MPNREEYHQRETRRMISEIQSTSRIPTKTQSGKVLQINIGRHRCTKIQGIAHKIKIDKKNHSAVP
jgi:hypothetical protein